MTAVLGRFYHGNPTSFRPMCISRECSLPKSCGPGRNSTHTLASQLQPVSPKPAPKPISKPVPEPCSQGSIHPLYSTGFNSVSPLPPMYYTASRSRSAGRGDICDDPGPKRTSPFASSFSIPSPSFPSSPTAPLTPSPPSHLTPTSTFSWPGFSSTRFSLGSPLPSSMRDGLPFSGDAITTSPTRLPSYSATPTPRRVRFSIPSSFRSPKRSPARKRLPVSEPSTATHAPEERQPRLFLPLKKRDRFISAAPSHAAPLYSFPPHPSPPACRRLRLYVSDPCSNRPIPEKRYRKASLPACREHLEEQFGTREVATAELEAAQGLLSLRIPVPSLAVLGKRLRDAIEPSAASSHSCYTDLQPLRKRIYVVPLKLRRRAGRKSPSIPLKLRVNRFGSRFVEGKSSRPLDS